MTEIIDALNNKISPLSDLLSLKFQLHPELKIQYDQVFANWSLSNNQAYLKRSQNNTNFIYQSVKQGSFALGLHKQSTLITSFGKIQSEQNGLQQVSQKFGIKRKMMAQRYICEDEKFSKYANFQQNQHKNKLCKKLINLKLSEIRQFCKFKKDLKKSTIQTGLSNRSKFNPQSYESKDKFNKQKSNQFLEGKNLTYESLIQLNSFVKQKQNKQLLAPHNQKTFLSLMEPNPQKFKIKSEQPEGKIWPYAFLTVKQTKCQYVLKCYFLDEHFNRIRVKSSHMRMQVFNKVLSELSYTQAKDEQQMSFIKLNSNFNQFFSLKVNPQTGQLFLQAKILSFSKMLSPIELVNGFQSTIKASKKQLMSLHKFLCFFSESKQFQSLQQSNKYESLINETKTILKADLKLVDTWLDQKIGQHKVIEKKRDDQRLLSYTFPKKVPEYEIMEDCFLSDEQKLVRIRKLKQQRLSQVKPKQNLCGQLQKYLNESKFDRNQVAYSLILLSLKKSIHQTNMQIQKSSRKSNSRQPHQQNRKRCVSTSLPNIPNEFTQINKPSHIFLTESNLKLIKHQVDLIKNRLSSLNVQRGINHRESYIDTIVKLPFSGSPDRFYQFKLVSIQQLQRQIQVQKILKPYIQRSYPNEKQSSLAMYLFEYKNFQIYGPWIRYQKINKTQKSEGKINPDEEKEFTINTNKLKYNDELSISIKVENNPKSQSSIIVSSGMDLEPGSFNFNFSVDKISYNQSVNHFLTPNPTYNNKVKSDINQFSFDSLSSLRSEQKSQTVLKLQTDLIPTNYLFEDRKLLSIKSASKVISLSEFLNKNRKITRFPKKIYIFRQIVQFCYFLQYFSIDKQLCFEIQDISITKFLTIKLDPKINKLSSHKNKWAYILLVQAFSIIFFEAQFLSNSFIDSSKTINDCEFILSENIEKIEQQGQSRSQRNHIRSRFENISHQIKERTYSMFLLSQQLSYYGNFKSLKFIWNLLVKYATSICSQQPQFFQEEYNLAWLLTLVQKVQAFENIQISC